MNEFEKSWPISDDIRQFERHAAQGLAIIENQLILPADGRWDVAYGSLVQGGLASTVHAEGDPGTGKTQFGNIVMGEQNRTDIAATDTVETLEGYYRPTDGKLNVGKMHINPNDVRLFLNEISHLRDTGPLHKYWDANEIDINGAIYDLSNASTYLTSNFKDGARSKDLDTALRSRIGVSVLAGDNTSAIAGLIQGKDLGKVKDTVSNVGLLPPSKTRQQIRELLSARYPLGRSSGEYMTNVLSSLNNTGLFVPITLTDSRIGQGWQQAVRAKRLVEGSSQKEVQIKNEDLAIVAALALGSVAVLNNSGNALFQEHTAKLDRLSPIEKAVIARRFIAAVAFKSVIDMGDFKNGDISGMTKFMQKRSYANIPNHDQIDGIIIDQLVNSPKQLPQESSNESRSRFRLRRSSK
ncbi:MAG: hypothetical protein WCJ60_02040 [bacterium]